MQINNIPPQKSEITSKFTLRNIIIFIIFIGAIVFIGITFKKLTEKRKENSAVKIVEKLPERNITIKEGWKMTDIAEYLEKEGIVKKEIFLKTANDFSTKDYPNVHSRPKGATLEGYLFPDTYRIFDYRQSVKTVDSTDISREILTKLLDNFSKKLTNEIILATKQRGLTIHELVTIASIVERETGRNAISEEQKKSLLEERKIVSGIFYNRLEIGMPIQSDATVNFATGKNLPSPTLEDLEINSPYNTYKFKGLPPGPISNPSSMSLEAVAFPTATNYFFFLHEQTTGKPIYSKTFEEHVKNKFIYLK